MTHICLDLETLGKGRDAAIATIGACVFDASGNITDTFYEVVELDESKHPGVLDPSTVYWWLAQQREAQLQLIPGPPNGGYPLGEVLRRFTDWVKVVKGKFLWSNGPLFDENILRDAYNRYDVKCPIHFRDSRCCRTIFALHKHSGVEKRERKGLHHNALDDACYQAKCIADILKARGLPLA